VVSPPSVGTDSPRYPCTVTIPFDAPSNSRLFVTCSFRISEFLHHRSFPSSFLLSFQLVPIWKIFLFLTCSFLLSIVGPPPLFPYRQYVPFLIPPYSINTFPPSNRCLNSPSPCRPQLETRHPPSRRFVFSTCNLRFPLPFSPRKW